MGIRSEDNLVYTHPKNDLKALEVVILEVIHATGCSEMKVEITVPVVASSHAEPHGMVNQHLRLAGIGQHETLSEHA